jgi:cytochrome c
MKSWKGKLKMPRNSFVRISVLVSIAMFATVAYAAESSSSPPVVKSASADDVQRTKALLAKAVAHYREKNELALAAFSRQGEFVDGDLYVYALDTNGIFLASGGSSSALIGRDVSKMSDAEGREFFREMLDKAKLSGSGTVEYRWLNQVHNKVERKVAYFEKVGDRIIAVGYYIPRATPQQAAAMLQRATEAVKADPTKAFAEFNEMRGSFTEDDLYVFVIRLSDGKFLAHGALPRLVGTDGIELRDPSGKPIIRKMINAVKTKDRGELDYSWLNPVTTKIEKKHTLFQKVAGFLVAVGYYTR